MNARVKIFGERNTGTNFVAQLLSLNYPVQILGGGPPYWWEKRFGLGDASMSSFFLLTAWRNYGWKHRRIDWSKLGGFSGVVVTLAKNPYSWLLSLHRRPYHNWDSHRLSFSEFLAEPWPVMRCDRLDARFVSPVQLWNEKHRSYLCPGGGAIRRCMGERYEDVLDSPEGFLMRFETLSGIDRGSERFRVVSRGAKSADKERSLDEYRRYYLEERWRSGLLAEDIARINAELDHDLVLKLGYEVLSS